MGTDNFHAKHQLGRQKKKENERERRQQTWLIVCEGKKTEANYFKGLISALNADSKTNILFKTCGEGKSTKSLINSVDKHFDFIDAEYGLSRIPYSKIIIVFDKDDFTADDFNTAIKQAYERYPSSIVAWSNESFELWLCLHFHYIPSALTRHQYNGKLTKIFRDVGVFDKTQNYAKHGKSMSDIYEKILYAGGSLENAMANAKKLEKENLTKGNPAVSNPVTMMYKAVAVLLKERTN